MAKSDSEFSNTGKIITYILLGIVFIVGGIFAILFASKHYQVWAVEQDGKAQLAKAEHTKKILIETAKAEKEAAQLQAEAIQILGKAAKDYPEYRNQMFIQAFGDALQNGNIEKIIYVPTEANIPLIKSIK